MPRDLWPFWRRPEPPRPQSGANPPPGFSPSEFIAWQRSTPVEGWMIVPTDPRMPTPVYDSTPQEEPSMTEPETEELELPEPPPPQRELCPACGGAKARVCEGCSRPMEDEPCSECQGSGYAPTVNDHLRASIALISDVGDQVIVEFYSRLFAAAPQIEVIFPPDLLDAEPGSDTRGFRQRDRLVGQIVNVAQWYDPFNPKTMQSLDADCQRMGRSHHSFALPDGGVFVPRRKHYDLVIACLMDTLHHVAGEAWRAEWDEAWDEAMEHVTDSMRHYARQWRSGFARLPRHTAEPSVRRRS